MSTLSVLGAGVPITKLPIYPITKSAATQPPGYQKTTWRLTWKLPRCVQVLQGAMPFLHISGVSQAYSTMHYKFLSSSILLLYSARVAAVDLTKCFDSPSFELIRG